MTDFWKKLSIGFPRQERKAKIYCAGNYTKWEDVIEFSEQCGFSNTMKEGEASIAEHSFSKNKGVLYFINILVDISLYPDCIEREFPFPQSHGPCNLAMTDPVGIDKEKSNFI